jgi:hypothetical protein
MVQSQLELFHCLNIVRMQIKESGMERLYEIFVTDKYTKKKNSSPPPPPRSRLIFLSVLPPRNTKSANSSWRLLKLIQKIIHVKLSSTAKPEDKLVAEATHTTLLTTIKLPTCLSYEKNWA